MGREWRYTLTLAQYTSTVAENAHNRTLTLHALTRMLAHGAARTYHGQVPTSQAGQRSRLILARFRR